ncbi:MAG: glycosyltransferase [Candidatus Omnitrophica bacterium]|nr:glycosyltransferase [Candidatus Omnitrophota bacterium]
MISVVMPSYNQAKFIRQSIDSVLAQKYPNLELIVVDGASTDGTVEILKGLKDSIRWVSEPDKGQADAINKGFSMSAGEVLAWLNADDLYAPDALYHVGEFFASHPDTMWAVGHVSIVDETGREIRKLISWYKAQRLRHYSYRALLTENFISQMGTFFRRAALQHVGGVEPSLYYAMDYDLWLRLGKQFTPGLIDKKLAKFRMYPTSKSITGFDRQFLEELDVAKKYAGRSTWPIFCHHLNKIKIVTIYKLMALWRARKERS